MQRNARVLSRNTGRSNEYGKYAGERELYVGKAETVVPNLGAALVLFLIPVAGPFFDLVLLLLGGDSRCIAPTPHASNLLPRLDRLFLLVLPQAGVSAAGPPGGESVGTLLPSANSPRSYADDSFPSAPAARDNPAAGELRVPSADLHLPPKRCPLPDLVDDPACSLDSWASLTPLNRVCPPAGAVPQLLLLGSPSPRPPRTRKVTTGGLDTSSCSNPLYLCRYPPWRCLQGALTSPPSDSSSFPRPALPLAKKASRALLPSPLGLRVSPAGGFLRAVRARCFGGYSAEWRTCGAEYARRVGRKRSMRGEAARLSPSWPPASLRRASADRQRSALPAWYSVPLRLTLASSSVEIWPPGLSPGLSPGQPGGVSLDRPSPSPAAASTADRSTSGASATPFP